MENIEQRVKKIVAEQLGVNEADIHVTGNTVIDALQMTLRQPAPALPCRQGRDFMCQPKQAMPKKRLPRTP